MKQKNIIIVLGIAVVVFFFFNPKKDQQKVLTESDRTRLVIKEKVKDDQRFKDINYFQSTNWKLPLRIQGNVETEKDLIELKKIIATIKTDTKIAYKITINEIKKND